MPIRMPTVAEAKATIHDAELCHSTEKVVAAHALMEVCEHDLDVTIEDMLRCLDYAGTIATVGARCLYVRTGRDGLGWKPGGHDYVVGRADWERYLQKLDSNNPA